MVNLLLSHAVYEISIESLWGGSPNFLKKLRRVTIVGTLDCSSFIRIGNSGGSKVGPDGALAPAVKHCAPAVEL